MCEAHRQAQSISGPGAGAGASIHSLCCIVSSFWKTGFSAEGRKFVLSWAPGTKPEPELVCDMMIPELLDGMMEPVFSCMLDRMASGNQAAPGVCLQTQTGFGICGEKLPEGRRGNIPCAGQQSRDVAGHAFPREHRPCQVLEWFREVLRGRAKQTRAPGG